MNSSLYIAPGRMGTPSPPVPPLNMIPTPTNLQASDCSTIALRQLILDNAALLDNGNCMVLCVHLGLQNEGKTKGPKAYMATLCMRKRDEMGVTALNPCHSGLAASSIVDALSNLWIKTAELVHEKIAAAHIAKSKAKEAAAWGRPG